MLDVFFISMDEVNAEENWQRLLKFRPDAKRVSNIVGIYEVHQICARLSATKNFWVVDADAWIVDDFDFSWKPDPSIQHWGTAEPDCLIVWPSINPVNDLVYGYGAVKVFPQQPFLENRSWSVDMSSSIVKVTAAKDQISCKTRFNATPESAWIGAFRECAKLASLSSIKTRIRRVKQQQDQELEELNCYVKSQTNWSTDKRTNYRRAQTTVILDRYKQELDIFNYWQELENYSQRRLTWCTHGRTRKNGKFVILGAQAGNNYGLRNSDDIAALNLINDWNWLKKEFKTHVGL